MEIEPERIINDSTELNKDDQIAEMHDGMVLVEGDGNEIKDFYICRHAVTQKEFEKTMGINPSRFQHGNPELKNKDKKNLEADTSDYPVEFVSWYDAIYYCNKRSMEEGLTPAYSVDGEPDIAKWNYEPCTGKEIRADIECNFDANCYRLPTLEEWQYAAKGGKESKGFKYSGSNDVDEVTWYYDNSKGVTHKIMQKKPNELGLYDMSGNVWEWVWDSRYLHDNYHCGGSYDYYEGNCEVDFKMSNDAHHQFKASGFRIVYSNRRDFMEIEPEIIINDITELNKDDQIEEMHDDMVLAEGDGNEIKDFYICRHAVTQKEFEKTMGINPSLFQHGNPELKNKDKKNLEADTSDYPVEFVSWYDAIYYCNKRSMEEGLTPAYSVNGETDIAKWNYEPCTGKEIRADIECNFDANGYRLPTKKEWQHAATKGKKGSKGFKYSGSNDIDEVAWYKDNSKNVTHKVMQKKPNEFGLYDMSGNVWEWVWYPYGSDHHYCGGSYCSSEYYCRVDFVHDSNALNQNFNIGFRIVCSLS